MPETPQVQIVTSALDFAALNFSSAADDADAESAPEVRRFADIQQDDSY